MNKFNKKTYIVRIKNVEYFLKLIVFEAVHLAGIIAEKSSANRFKFSYTKEAVTEKIYCEFKNWDRHIMH